MTLEARLVFDVGEALVVAEVEVGLGAVLGHEHLAVLVGRHRARVDVDVGVELLQADGQPARDEQASDRGRGDPLAERGDDAAGHEDEPGLARGAAAWRSDGRGVMKACPRSLVRAAPESVPRARRSSAARRRA